MAISVNHMKLPQAPPSDNQFTLLARAGREVVFLTLSLSLSPSLSRALFRCR